MRGSTVNILTIFQRHEVHFCKFLVQTINISEDYIVGDTFTIEKNRCSKCAWVLTQLSTFSYESTQNAFLVHKFSKIFYF